MNSPQLNINQVSIEYPNKKAVNNLSLTLEKGQIGCLLGPSGCGKTSLLRAIAGFEKPTNGEIKLVEHKVSDKHFQLPPEVRKVGMVFQDFALFPHLTIEKNIAFGLHQLTKKQSTNRVEEMLTMINLTDYAKSYPHQLSGGQQQRVALARAIAPQPDILLLDEPFSSLDAELREHIAAEVRKILKKNNITAMLVTHDQHEAFAMADIIGVMNQGELLQWDSAYNLYHKPYDPYVANFIGEGSIILAKTNTQGIFENELGIISSKNNCQANSEYRILVRPDDIISQPDSKTKLEIIDKRFRGAEYLYQLKMSDGQKILCITPSHIDLNLGEFLPITIDFQHLVIFSKHTKNHHSINKNCIDNV